MAYQDGADLHGAHREELDRLDAESQAQEVVGNPVLLRHIPAKRARSPNPTPVRRAPFSVAAFWETDEPPPSQIRVLETSQRRETKFQYRNM